MYFLKLLKKKISHAPKYFPFCTPIPQRLECSFLQNRQEELPRFISPYEFIWNVLAGWWRKQFYTWKVRVSLRWSQRAQVWKIAAPDNIQQFLRGSGKRTWQQEQHRNNYHSTADRNKCWFLLIWASWVYPCPEYHTWLAHGILHRGNDSNQRPQKPAHAICNTKHHI